MQCRITVKVITKANQTGIADVTDQLIRIRLKAVPEKGQANRELIRFLSDVLSIGLSRIVIKSGLASHQKIVAIDSMEFDEVMRRLRNAS